MLELALNHEKKLKIKLRQTWNNEKYKFYDVENYREDIELETSSWLAHDYVSVYKEEVIGYIRYQIDRPSEYVFGLGIINFEKDHKAVFAKDLGTALKDIFEKYNFRRLEWNVIVGNPVEKSYDKMCQRYGGRIVGTYTKRNRLIDGHYYDEKLYEIDKSDYDRAVNSKKFKERNNSENYKTIF